VASDPTTQEVVVAGDLREALERFSTRTTILVASDFDGVLAPLVDDPASARPLPGTMDILRDLAGRPRTHCAVVSGRDLDTLTRLTGLASDGRVTRIGSHGAQSSRNLASATLTSDERDLLGRVTTDLEELVGSYPDVRLEHKPTATVIHTRGGDAMEAESAIEDAYEIARRHSGVTVLSGKDILELSVVPADKGSALRALAEEVGADAVLYLGDDVTDEYAFEVLGPRDVGVKVGGGETAADHRVHTPEEAAAVLRLVRELRS
jgi:trehalose 6-phosphate phosphatase